MNPLRPIARRQMKWVYGGAAVALVAVLADQASKHWLLSSIDLGRRGPIEITPFFELILVWNRGISYGLFSQDSALGKWILIALTLGAIIALCIWLARAKRPAITLPVGLIIGGALGNLIDRITLGAVVDFAHFHVGRFSWYVFNLADVWIVAGVAILLYDSVRRR